MFRIFLPSTFHFFVLSFLAVNIADASFVLKGELPSSIMKTDLVILRETLETRKTHEVFRQAVRSGSFEVEVEEEPGLFVLRVQSSSAKFVAEAGDSLSVEIDGEALNVMGSEAQTDFAQYELFRKDSLARLVYPVRRELSEVRKSGDEAKVEELTRLEVTNYNAHKAELNDFSIDDIKGTAALYASSLRWKGDHRLDELEEVVNAYAVQHPDLKITQLMLDRIARFRATELGAEAPALEGESPSGETIVLSDYRGKVVMVDFWAAWCPPCRIANREYVSLYSDFKDKGFEIFAVSLDRNKGNWVRGIKQDNASWVHLSDLVGWGSPLAESYNVSSLPSNFLLDREGRVLAKDVHGEKLRELLEEHL